MAPSRRFIMSRRTIYLMIISFSVLLIFYSSRTTLVASFLLSIMTKLPISQFHAASGPTNKIQLSSNALTYVWCSGKNPRWFEFHHFLSIKSAIHFLSPDNIFFYYDKYPEEDSQHYNTWLEELTSDYPFFLPIGMGAKDMGCVDLGKPNISFVVRNLALNRGIYLKEDTILTGDLEQDLKYYNTVVAYNSKNKDYDLITANEQVWNSFRGEHVLTAIEPNIDCSRPDEYSNGTQARCVKPDTPLYPRDIWELDSRYGQLIRTIFYGKPELAKPTPNYTELIPNIAHIIWIDGKMPVDFLFYLGILSLLHIAKVDKIYVHGGSPPTGYYWSLVKDNPKVQVVYRSFQGKVFGTDVKVIEHISDVLRADILIKYGGIYMDVDAVIVNPIDPKLLGYDVVMSHDLFFSQRRPFPDLLNAGVTIAKKNTKFWKLQLQSMKRFLDSEFDYNALKMPYKIKERNPETLLIDSHLQVMCYKLVCLPSWMGHLAFDETKHIPPNSFPTWRTSNNFIHWPSPTPNELSSHETLLKSGNKTVFANIGMYILETSGMLAYFQKSLKNK